VSFSPLDPRSGMDKKSGSGMSNSDQISKILETIFWVKMLKFFDADPGTGMEKILIRYKLLKTSRIRNTVVIVIKNILTSAVWR
jgi:hypothetical protein